MEYIGTDLLEEGLTVAKDVYSQSKMLLIPAGTKLSTNKIQLLKTWGIRRIFIEASEDLSATQSVIKQKEAELIIDRLMVHNPSNKFVDALKLAAARYWRRKMGQNL